MVWFKIEAETDEGPIEGFVTDEEAIVHVECNSNDEQEKVGLARWFNSARIHVDPEKDEVTCVVSVGDPRGGFAFTVRRKPDGELILHMPYPGESLPHQRTKQLHEGTLLVVGDSGKPLTFEDEESLDREEGWRNGWGAMEDGESMPDDDDAPYGIMYRERSKDWAVTEDGAAVKGEYYSTPDDAAERAEEMNEEAAEEDDED